MLGCRAYNFNLSTGLLAADIQRKGMRLHTSKVGAGLRAGCIGFDCWDEHLSCWLLTVHPWLKVTISLPHFAHLRYGEIIVVLTLLGS